MKFKHTIILILMSAPFSFANAEEDLICEDLYKLTCAPGTYDDGTGVAKNPTIQDDELKNVQNDVIAKSKDKFRNILSDPNKSFFRKAVLSATGLSANPDCKGADKIVKPKDSCLELLLTGMGDITAKKMLAKRSTKASYTVDDSGNYSDEVYVLDSREFKDVEEQILTEMKKKLKIDELDKKVKESIFPKIKELLKEKIPLMIADPELREKILIKIGEIEFSGTNCPFTSEEGKEHLSDFLINNAYYMPNRRDFKYCSGVDLQNKSEFQIAFTIAHELTHSIDPCGIIMGPHAYSFRYPDNLTKIAAEQLYPLAGVLGCLRTPQSLGAIDRQTFETKKQTKTAGLVNNGLMQTAQMQTQPAASPQSNNYFCDGDQITEGVSDWMAAEILPDYIQKYHEKLTPEQLRIGYSNVWRGSCYEVPPDKFDEHPNAEKRVNNLLLMHPKIRKQMGCNKPVSGKVYCQSNVDYQRLTSPPPDTSGVNQQ